VTVGFAVAGLNDFRQRSEAVPASRAEAANLVRVQEIRTKLVTADAAAANVFLLGRDVPETRQRQYGHALHRALLDLGLVTRASRADRNDLAIANRWVGEYADRVAAAHLLARQGRADEGAEALAAASGLLRAEVLPRIERVQFASGLRLAEQEDRVRSAGTGLGLLALLALAVLVGGQVWLARVSHRILNLPLVLATVAVLVVAGLGLATAQTSRSRADDVRECPREVADALVQARLAAFDARANESLTLIRPQGRAQREQAWQDALGTVTNALRIAGRVPGRETAVAGVLAQLGDPDAPRTRPVDYVGAHRRVVAEESAGRHADAVAHAVSDAPGGATGEFDDVDLATSAMLDREQDAVDAGLAAAGEGLARAGWLWLLGGLAAALLAWAGVSRRLAEFR
jgi:hypothetical protein